MFPKHPFCVLLFNIYICDFFFFFFETEDLDIASYADDNTPLTCSSDLNEVLSKLKIDVRQMLSDFKITILNQTLDDVT